MSYSEVFSAALQLSNSDLEKLIFDLERVFSLMDAGVDPHYNDEYASCCTDVEIEAERQYHAATERENRAASATASDDVDDLPF